MDRRVIANVILGFGCIALVQQEFFLGAGLIALSCLVRKERRVQQEVGHGPRKGPWDVRISLVGLNSWTILLIGDKLMSAF